MASLRLMLIVLISMIGISSSIKCFSYDYRDAGKLPTIVDGQVHCVIIHSNKYGLRKMYGLMYKEPEWVIELLKEDCIINFIVDKDHRRFELETKCMCSEDLCNRVEYFGLRKNFWEMPKLKKE